MEITYEVQDLEPLRQQQDGPLAKFIKRQDPQCWAVVTSPIGDGGTQLQVCRTGPSVWVPLIPYNINAAPVDAVLFCMALGLQLQTTLNSVPNKFQRLHLILGQQIDELEGEPEQFRIHIGAAALALGQIGR